MKKKRAIALRKLCGFNPHRPRTYHAIPTGAEREEAKFNEKGERIVTKRPMLMMVSNKERQDYQSTKNAYKKGELK